VANFSKEIQISFSFTPKTTGGIPLKLTIPALFTSFAFFSDDRSASTLTK